jgi:hypothetical protein
MTTHKGDSHALPYNPRHCKAIETIYGVRLHVFKLKFEPKVLVSGLQSVTGSMEKPKSASWQLSSAGPITSSILGAS